ncbi:MAG: FtsW/RodA/SpoVE family cell cycle protein, partial [Cyanobacteria bacterium]|nr:FtsW/RodA/SpoVE family cell cycle protein [Cyanobacteriota bacterium]
MTYTADRPTETFHPSRHNITSKIVHETVVTAMDQPLLCVTLVLIMFGLTSVYSASAHQSLAESGNSLSYLIKQMIAALIGLGAMVAVSRINFQCWRRFAFPLGLGAISLLLLTTLVGTTANGSERWLPLPFGFQFQPSDLAKIAAIALIAQITSQKKLFTAVTVKNLGLVLVMIYLIYKQPNLSVSLILGSLMGMMFFVAGLPKFVFAVSIPLTVYAVQKNIMETPYQLRRIQGWLDPWKDPQDVGYNLIQSYYAIGSGGLLGVGLGHSAQKLYYLPFQHTDFIFSVICEELGLPGALILIGLYATVAWRG